MTTTISKPKIVTKTRSEKQISPMAKALKCAAQAVGITPACLTTWFSQCPQLSETTQETCLRLIAEYRLNPRADELDLMQFEEGRWQVFITVNGWAKLINAHPAFCGIELSEASE